MLAVSHGSASRAFVECSGAPGLQESFRYCKEIEFKIEEIGDFFKAELYQIGSTSSPITPHDTPHVTPHVEKLLLCCEKPAGREQLQEKLGIRDRKYFYKTFLKPALKTGLLEMTIPEKPRSKLQKYQLTEAGPGRQTPMMVNYRVNAGIIPPDVWVQDPEVGGGRIVGEVCHFIDFASFVIGADPVAVQAMCVDSTNASLKAEDNVTIAVKYRDGSVAQICYVAVGPSDLAKEYCEVFADESAAVMDNFCTTRCMGRRGKKRLKGSQKKGFSEEIAAFLEAVQTGAPSPIPFDSLALTTACTFAARESLRTGCGVRPALL
ncbi:Gfo/Idh/MocA family protein [Desulfotignum phosphitoxidans]|uniref:Uncharacterized protein n=1 Tax=Desulfotignum phosphitoxidans DSM 13687 TaxID=1286635 RepID=S0G2B0_9BACT|nr:Gfo/Idh/MocA family oxidoreductase [Desulfotignum phosphitoxidans]EMS77856.1 hypothetical protein Dpo_12c01340 [Desulfotignum phosphitoxidans DSM 13687]